MKKYREKSTLNEAQKKFKTLLEWNYYGGLDMDEADDDPNAQQPQGGAAMPPQEGGMQDGGGMPQGGPDQTQQGPNGEGMPPMGGDPNANAGGDPNMGDPNGQQPPMGDAPMPQDGGEMPPMGAEPSMRGEDDTQELDVDDLTNAQEILNKKINRIVKDYGNTDKQISAILQGIDKLNQKIDSDNMKIADLSKELARRNPTPLEKLNLRSVNDSYPFNVKPTDFWNDKTANSNYRLTDNDNDENEYVIYSDDLDDSPADISGSFNDDDYDDEINTMKPRFGF